MDLKLRSNSILKRPWLALSVLISLICIVVMVFVFNYVDGDVYIAWSMDFLDCLFGKANKEFYEYSALNLHIENSLFKGCDKSVLMILPLAIWNIPVWIAHQITGEMIVTGIWDIAWMKLGFILCIVITAVECTKIVKAVRPDANSGFVFPLMLGSFDVLCSTLYAAQDEIVYLMVLVIAMRHMINRKIILFLVFSALSVALNPEMIIPVILMILFYEERIWKVFLDAFICVVPLGIINFIYRNNEVYNNARVTGYEFSRSLFSTDIGLKIGENTVSLFIILICLMLFFVYAHRDEKPDNRNLVWSMALLMVSMTLLSTGGYINYFYRDLLYVPFLIILILTSEQNSTTNIILYLLYTWGRSILGLVNGAPQSMSSAYLSINNITLRRIYDNVGKLIMGKFYGDKISLLANSGLITAVCLSVAIVIFYINSRSGLKKEYRLFEINKDILVAVNSLLVPIILLAFVYMFICKDSYYYCKDIKFGSSFVEYNLEELDAEELSYNSSIHVFPTQIVYEDNLYLTDGEDKDGIRYIEGGGVSFGPYISLYPGIYQVTVYGQGLERAGIDCGATEDEEFYSIPANPMTVTDDSITYYIQLDEYTSNIEFRVYNHSSKPITLDMIKISECEHR